MIYLRDEETGEIWGPTALPIRQNSAAYSVRHGQGYSRFELVSRGIGLELVQFVPVADSIKIARLKIVNQSARERRISVTAYVEWVLGQSRAANAPFIVTEIDPVTGAMFAQNGWNNQFGERVAFADMNGRQTAYTADRLEFIGRDGALDRPLGLTPGAVLSNRVGAGLDPCGALQTQLRLNAGATTEIVFFLGQGATKTEAQTLVAKYRAADLNAVFANVVKQWDDMLFRHPCRSRTPDRALDLLLNRWLPYQTLACRLWARTGFYQASGAYGFRDQLPGDVLALCVARPAIARAHLLRAAARPGSPKAMFNTGGCRNRIAASARASAMIRIWPSSRRTRTMFGSRAMPRFWTKWFPSWRGPVLEEGQRDAFAKPASNFGCRRVQPFCAFCARA